MRQADFIVRYKPDGTIGFYDITDNLVTVGGIVASATETELTNTSATNVINYTTTAAGNYVIYVYLRVVTGATVITLTYNWTDVTGAQSYTYLSAISEATGSYIIQPVFVNATTGTAIQVAVTAGTSNQVYVSASVVKSS
jgi:hypothetical protein